MGGKVEDPPGHGQHHPVGRAHSEQKADEGRIPVLLISVYQLGGVLGLGAEPGACMCEARVSGLIQTPA